MKVDYIIVGQGIAGSLLSRSLLNAGKSVLVIDEANPASASRVAGGIINPVTGKRMVRSWMIEELLPFALDTYRAIESELSISILRQVDLLDFPVSREAQDILQAKLLDETKYLHSISDEAAWAKYFRFNYGIGSISPCLLVDIALFLDTWRARLRNSGVLMEDKFDWDDIRLHGGEVVYKSVSAGKVICCGGPAGADNPYFKMLPWSKDKGEALIASIPGLPRNIIFKQGISIVPWNEDSFWIGASHDWKFTDLLPSTSFRKKVEEQLDYWLKVPYRITDHIVGQRPANMDRKPFVGVHPVHSSIAIFNGMGGKALSMAPYFAHHLAGYLSNQNYIMPDVDVSRFEKVLSR